ncbi:MAG: hypothetical protein WBE44_12390 [Terriglobales bacterium]
MGPAAFEPADDRSADGLNDKDDSGTTEIAREAVLSGMFID